MGNLRKIVGVSLAVAVALGLVAYVLIPHAGPANESIVVNQPQSPTTPGGSTSTGTGTTGGTTTTNPPPTSDHVRLPKLHGKNSEGPKHVICLPANPHVQGTAQYQGANWYRGQCVQTAGANSQGHANGHAGNLVVAAYFQEHSRVGQEH